MRFWIPIRELFPECERVTCYASPSSIRIRTEEELRTLRAKGLTMVYMGLESGCDEVLTLMRKGHTAADIVAMGQKVRQMRHRPLRHGHHRPGRPGAAGAPRRGDGGGLQRHEPGVYRHADADGGAGHAAV